MAAPRGERFPKALRLRARREFVHVQEQGVKVAAGPLLGLALRSGRPATRVGLTVSSKVGNAVERVRIRRRLRELFRRRRGLLPGGLDVVLIARPAAKQAETPALAQAFEAIAVKLRSLFP
jgi:ribonuclease P protein component